MENIEPASMNTLSECTNKLAKQGYTEIFQITPEGMKALSDEKMYPPSVITISNFFRFEGQNDPSDNSIVYVIETNDGKKGTLIDAYGPNADATIGEFIKQVEDFQKKKSS